jgi:hypothetical protein
MTVNGNVNGLLLAWARVVSCMGRRGRDRMAVGFTATCAISAYHH